MCSDVLCVAIVDMVPSSSHSQNLLSIIKLIKERLLKFFWCWSRNNPRYIHIWITSPSETKINHSNHLIIFVKQNISEV